MSDMMTQADEAIRRAAEVFAVERFPCDEKSPMCISFHEWAAGTIWSFMAPVLAAKDARITELEAERDALREEKRRAYARRVYAMYQEATRQLKAAREVIDASRCIRHWHDWGPENEGMVVSQKHVFALWEALEKHDSAHQPRKAYPGFRSSDPTDLSDYAGDAQIVDVQF